METNQKTGNQVLTILIFLILVLGFGIDLYAPSFPELVSAFRTTPQWIQLTVPTYLVGYVLGLALLGPISDRFGLKRIIILGIIFYLIFSCLSTLATNVSTFLFLRVLQGVGAASIGVTWPPLLSSFFTGKRLAAGMSYLSISYRISPLIAPLIGGYLAVLFGWQSNFYFLSLYLLILLIPIALFLPKKEGEKSSLMFKQYFSLLQYPNFLKYSSCAGIIYAMLIIFNIVGPFFIQDILGYSPIAFGHMAFFIGLMTLLGSFSNRLLLHKLEIPQIIKLGAFVVLLLSIALCALAFFLPKSLSLFLISVGLISFSSGLVGTNLFTILIGGLKEGKGAASSLIGIIQIATTILLTFLASFLKSSTIVPFSIAYLCMGILTFFLSKNAYRTD